MPLFKSTQRSPTAPTCQRGDGGYECFVTSYPDGYGLAVTEPLGFNGIFNDVRAANSPEVSFHVEVCRFAPIRRHPLAMPSLLRLPGARSAR